MSDLVALFTVIANTSISVDGIPIPVRDLGELPNRVDTADLPVRFLNQFSGDDFELFTVMNNSGTSDNRIIWTIQDLMLWKPTGQGLGIRETMPLIAEYAGKYAEMCRTLQIPTNNTQLQSVSIDAGMVEWPASTGSWYMGCTCTISFRENLVT